MIKVNRLRRVLEMISQYPYSYGIAQDKLDDYSLHIQTNDFDDEDHLIIDVNNKNKHIYITIDNQR